MNQTTKDSLNRLGKAIEATEKYLRKLPAAYLEETTHYWTNDQGDFSLYFDEVLQLEGPDDKIRRLQEVNVTTRLMACQEIPKLIDLAETNEYLVNQQIQDVADFIEQRLQQ